MGVWRQGQRMDRNLVFRRLVLSLDKTPALRCPYFACHQTPCPAFVSFVTKIRIHNRQL